MPKCANHCRMLLCSWFNSSFVIQFPSQKWFQWFYFQRKTVNFAGKMGQVLPCGKFMWTYTNLCEFKAGVVVFNDEVSDCSNFLKSSFLIQFWQICLVKHWNFKKFWRSGFFVFLFHLSNHRECNICQDCFNQKLLYNRTIQPDQNFMNFY